MASCQRGHAQRVQVALALEQAAVVLVVRGGRAVPGHHGHRALVQGAGRAAVGVALEAAVRGVGAVGHRCRRSPSPGCSPRRRGGRGWAGTPGGPGPRCRGRPRSAYRPGTPTSPSRRRGSRAAPGARRRTRRRSGGSPRGCAPRRGRSGPARGHPARGARGRRRSRAAAGRPRGRPRWRRPRRRRRAPSSGSTARTRSPATTTPWPGRCRWPSKTLPSRKTVVPFLVMGDSYQLAPSKAISTTKSVLDRPVHHGFTCRNRHFPAR